MLAKTVFKGLVSGSGKDLTGKRENGTFGSLIYQVHVYYVGQQPGFSLTSVLPYSFDKLHCLYEGKEKIHIYSILLSIQYATSFTHQGKLSGTKTSNQGKKRPRKILTEKA